MSACGLTVATPTDAALVASVRAGQEAAFEELYRRYRPRINAFVRRFVRDDGRAEDVTQEAFLSALRRMRVTDSEIVFKPWIYEIARNAAIDSHRRSRRAEEVSMEAVELMRPSDRLRLLGTAAPDAGVLTAERLQYLRGAFDELSETHHRVLVMREFEGRSYREIAERLDLTRPAVESTLFRARRRLERTYAELETGRRCEAVYAAIGRLAEGMEEADDIRRLARHARRCTACRRRARELGVEPFGRVDSLRARAAALLPLPALLRSRLAGPGPSSHGPLVAFGPAAGESVAAFAERAAALLAAAALASAGSAMLQERLQPGNDSVASPPQAAPAAGFGIPRLVLPSAPAGRDPGRRAHRAGGRQQHQSATGSRTGAAPRPAASSGSREGVAVPSQPTLPAPSTTKLAAGVRRTTSGASESLTRAVADLQAGLPSPDSVLNMAGQPGALTQKVKSTLLGGWRYRGQRARPTG